jgi:hypothetical protein
MACGGRVSADIADEGLVKSQYRPYTKHAYGIDAWAEMFTARQRYVLAVVSSQIV